MVPNPLSTNDEQEKAELEDDTVEGPYMTSDVGKNVVSNTKFQQPHPDDTYDKLGPLQQQLHLTDTYDKLPPPQKVRYIRTYYIYMYICTVAMYVATYLHSSLHLKLLVAYHYCFNV